MRRSKNGSVLDRRCGSSDSLVTGINHRSWRILNQRASNHRLDHRSLQVICRKEYTYRQIIKIPNRVILICLFLLEQKESNSRILYEQFYSSVSILNQSA
jgi:hypothetical protein